MITDKKKVFNKMYKLKTCIVSSVINIENSKNLKYQIFSMNQFLEKIKRNYLINKKNKKAFMA